MIEGNQGVLFEANCETDFVSKNPDFIDFTKSVAQMIVKESPADVAALSAMPMGGQHSHHYHKECSSEVPHFLQLDCVYVYSVLELDRNTVIMLLFLFTCTCVTV